MINPVAHRARIGSASVAEPLECRRLLSVSLVKDLATLPNGTFEDDTQPLVPLAGSVYFDLDTALWKSNGTAAGTSAVKDFSPLAPLPATVVGTSLFFTVDDGAGDFDLWKSNGTATGTTKVATLPPIDALQGYGNFTAVGNTLFFTQPPDVSNFRGPATLWRSDGTAAGTFALGSLPASGTGIYSFAALDGKLIFANIDATHGYEPWISDGTVAGTKPLSDINPGTGDSGPSQFVTAGGKVFFTATGPAGAGLWKTDGTAAGTAPVKALLPGIDDLTAVGTGVFFQVQPSFGTSPPKTGVYRSDGTDPGTVLVQPMTAPAGGTIPLVTFADVNGTAFLIENNHHELWKSSGTAAGTAMLKSFSGSISERTNLNGTLVFVADDGSSGAELWKSDGTSSGTVLLKDIYPEATGSEPSELAVSGGKLYFKAADPTYGRELWTSDGTAGGTKLVADLTTGTHGFDLHETLPVGNLLFFGGRTDVLTDYALYRTDGTTAGTFALTQGVASDLIDAGGTVFFRLDSLTTGLSSLWKSDGTVDGTVMIATINVDAMTAVGTTVFFESNQKLWKSDGTPAGTVMLTTSGPVTDLASGPAGPVYYVMETLSGNRPAPPYTLWATDGTPANTVSLGTFSQNLDEPLVVGSRLYFEADDGTNAGLWTSDGTAAGTTFLSTIPPDFSEGAAPQTAVLNGRLLYFGNAGNADTFLWSTDGTPTGTAPVADIMADGTALLPQSLTVAGNYAYFTATNVMTGAVSLWRTDGTSRGTSLLIPDIGTTVTGDSPTLAAFDGNLYFPATLDPAIGPELYVVDSGGVALAADVVPGATGSYPDKLVSIGDALLFTADDGVHGRELWNFSLPANSISGRVYNDANHDAFQQPSEQGIKGVTVFLDTNNDGKLETGEPSVKTDATGTYAFSNVTAGTYSVRVIDPTGYRRNAPLLANASATSGPTPQPTGTVFGEVAVSSVPLDFTYLLSLAQHYNAPGTFAQGDLNRDDKVDFADLLILAQHYGKPLSTAAVKTGHS